MILRKNKCNKETVAKVVRIYNNQFNEFDVMRVEYLVNGKKYYIEEPIKSYKQLIQWGIVIINNTSFPVIQDLKIGKELTVLYNPKNPKKAYIKENK